MSVNVLIVEDEVFVALEMQAILEENGYSVLGIAADLPGALAYADADVDLALVDLNLRDGLTGPDIGRHLATESRASVLFVTANPRLLGNGIAGTVGVLTKPTDDKALLSAVDYAIQRRRGNAVEAPKAVRCFG